MYLVYKYICLYIIPFILLMHYCWLTCDSNSKYQKNRLRNNLTYINSHLVLLNEVFNDGIRFHELKVIYKNREFMVGVIKNDHSHEYTTYNIFINGEEAGVLHQVGDCCESQYYFEKQNHRDRGEVMAIVEAGAKVVKNERDKNTKKLAKEALTWDSYSYFK